MSNSKFLKQRLSKLIGHPKHSSSTVCQPPKTKPIGPRPLRARSSLFKDYTYITLQKQYRNERLTTDVVCYNDGLVFAEGKELLESVDMRMKEGSDARVDNDEQSQFWGVKEEIRRGCARLKEQLALLQVENGVDEREWLSTEGAAGEERQTKHSSSSALQKQSSDSVSSP